MVGPEVPFHKKSLLLHVMTWPNVFDDVNTPIASIMIILYPYIIILYPIAHMVWKILPNVLQFLVLIYPLSYCCFFFFFGGGGGGGGGGENLDDTCESRDSRTSCQLVSPFIINKHIHPFRICNRIYHCFLNCVIQILLLILRTISPNFQFHSNKEGSLSKCSFQTVHPILRM